MTTGRINQVTDRRKRENYDNPGEKVVDPQCRNRYSLDVFGCSAIGPIAIGTTFQSVGVQSYYVRDEIVECRSRRTDIWPTILVPDRVASLQSPTSETACAAVKAPKVFAESRVSKTNLLSQLSDFSHLLYI